MMRTRRDFLKNAILLSGAAGMSGMLPVSIQRALSINPAQGSTYLDAEHIVILMQENRSFDHCFGTLKGVRGYNDPRVIHLPNGLPAWLQTDKQNRTYAPFRLNIQDTKTTWMGDLPHGRASQVDAWNYGKYNNWLDAKKSNHAEYADIPLTMGYYNREDLPFNYALADAFTICDQHFCSTMSSTIPNRSYFWTGRVKSKEDGWMKANLNNNDYARAGNYMTAKNLSWPTFPEMLQKNGIDWRFYQNDLRTGGLMTYEERSWLLNFGCNILEYWTIYHTKFNARYIQTIESQIEELKKEIKTLDKDRHRIEISKKGNKIKRLLELVSKWNQDSFNKLSEFEKELHKRAFITNAGDPYYRELTKFVYNDHGMDRELNIPKGDIFFQFRKDVEEGNLGTVNWLASPRNFSDHPSVPWYGNWYTSQILDILTQNPEVWKKTIFILTYDENDGYFDHVPPFSVPDPKKPGTGKVSSNIDTEREWVRRENELRQGISEKNAREAPLGLGFRVPMIIASPWSRGGKVCSEVFDHTSTLQFLEIFLNRKFKKDMKFENISQWRRTICGNLTSNFTPFTDGNVDLPFINKEKKIEDVYNAQYKQIPSNYKILSARDIKNATLNPDKTDVVPIQEPGVKSSVALPYELKVDGHLNENRFEITYGVGNKVFGKASSGAPFTVYSPGKNETSQEEMKVWHYAVSPGDTLMDSYDIDQFKEGKYHLIVHGPNGFLREFKGDRKDPDLSIICDYKLDDGAIFSFSGDIELKVLNNGYIPIYLEVVDNGYEKSNNKVVSFNSNGKPKQKGVIIKGLHGWYDFEVCIRGNRAFKRRYAGRIETGKITITDPIMGRIIKRST